MADALGTAGGVVSAVDHRLDQAGMIAAQTSTLAVRTGVMVGPGSTTLVTGTSATGTMTYSIAAHHWVTTRGTADGVYLGTKEATTTVATTAAPGANSRIDVIWSKQQDAGSTISADGSTAEQYGVSQGTAAASPTAPSIPVGAVEIARSVVAAGATSTNGANVTITNTAAQTVARGARVPVRTLAERDALTAFPGLEVYRLDNGQVQICTATGTPATWVTTFDPAAPPRASKVYSAAAYTGAAVSGTAITLRTIAIPDPGWPWLAVVDARQDVLVSTGSNWNFTARVDTGIGELIRPVGVVTSTTYVSTYINGGVSSVLTGAHSILFNAEKISGAAGDGYQVNPVTNLQSYRVLVIPA